MGVIFEAVRPVYEDFIGTIDSDQLVDSLATNLTRSDVEKIHTETRNNGKTYGMRLLVMQIEGKIGVPTLLIAIFKMGHKDLVYSIFENYARTGPRASLRAVEQRVYDELCDMIKNDLQTATRQHRSVDDEQREAGGEHQAARNSPTYVLSNCNVQIGSHNMQNINRMDSGSYSDGRESTEGEDDEYEVVAEPSSDSLHPANSSHQEDPVSRPAENTSQYISTGSASRRDESSPNEVPLSRPRCRENSPGEMPLSPSRRDESSPLSVPRCDGNGVREMPVSSQEIPALDNKVVRSLGVVLGVHVRETSPVSHSDETEPKEIETGGSVDYFQPLSSTPSVNQCSSSAVSELKNLDEELENKVSAEDLHETPVKQCYLREQDSYEQDCGPDESHFSREAECSRNQCVSDNVDMASLNTLAAENSVSYDANNINFYSLTHPQGAVNNVEHSSDVNGDHRKTAMSYSAEPTNGIVIAAATQNRLSCAARQVIKVCFHCAHWYNHYNKYTRT